MGGVDYRDRRTVGVVTAPSGATPAFEGPWSFDLDNDLVVMREPLEQEMGWLGPFRLGDYVRINGRHVGEIVVANPYGLLLTDLQAASGVWLPREGIHSMAPMRRAPEIGRSNAGGLNPPPMMPGTPDYGTEDPRA